jgi:glucose-1-phosphate adenylyltransferase
VVESGTRIAHAVIGVRSCIGRDASIRDCVMIGADRDETDTERQQNARRAPPASASATAPSSNAPSSTRTRVSAATFRITNQRGLENHEGENYVIRDGIVVVPRGAVVPDGTVI